MTEDLMPLLGIDHLEFWVGNARQAAYFYSKALGFTPVAYAGLETGTRDKASYVLQQGDIRFVVSGSLSPDHEIAEHVRLHGDGVKVVSISVPDAEHAWKHATAQGARSFQEPTETSDENGILRTSAIHTYGETIHLFVDRSAYNGAFAPGYKDLGNVPDDVGLRSLDHVVGNVELGKMQEWVKFYEDVFGMTEMIHFTDKAISTEYSALMSKVCVDGSGRIKFPINEPAEGKRKSQIEEYLDYYKTPGVQHIALASDDIVKTVDALHARGVDFLTIPGNYYEDAMSRVGTIEEDYKDLERLGILVDRDDEGYLLQIFTANAQDRPTVFFEVIERHGSRGFGEGNFKALFEAIEREQDARGNL
ncbi:MAG: 4-hydroxyphenylpyruvate dioxygenase [Actinomycetota bacterium]|nr:4-hydroxyphenylpyruvate dioxygenase [Actinomycetota bacterium]